MAAELVGTAPVKLARAGQAPAIQNLGPGVVYLDTNEDVSTTSGVRVAIDALYEFPRDLTEDLYAISDTAGTDVRVMMVG